MTDNELSDNQREQEPTLQDERELWVMEHLASGTIYKAVKNSVRGHDGWLLVNGQPQIRVETTQYIADRMTNGDSIQMRSVKAWREKLWPYFDTLRRQHESLRSVKGSVSFVDGNAPKNTDLKPFALELVECVKAVVEEVDIDRYMLVDVSAGDYESIESGRTLHVGFNPKQYPMLTKYLDRLSLFECSLDWYHWSGPAETGGFIVIDPQELKYILETKAAKSVNYPREDLPLWLVIEFDSHDDVRTHLLADRDDDSKLIQAVAQCGYDFTDCPFDQVWGVSHFGGHKLLLYPNEVQVV